MLFRSNLGYPGTDKGTFYVYGFRVPLLVISKYAKPGYISGASVYPPQCPNTYCHDFGSILNFIEHIFGLSTIGPSGWPYADFFAQDQGTAGYSLNDFFGTTAYQFSPITSAKYATKCFWNKTQAKCFPKYPAAPDSD